MARRARAISCTNEDRAILLNISNSRTASFSEVLRAKIILFCIQGIPLAHIATRLTIGMTTVIRWRNRFIEEGIKGLGDHHRNGRPAVYTQDFREKVLKTLESAPPEGYGQWTGALLAEECIKTCCLAFPQNPKNKSCPQTKLVHKH